MVTAVLEDFVVLDRSLRAARAAANETPWSSRLKKSLIAVLSP